MILYYFDGYTFERATMRFAVFPSFSVAVNSNRKEFASNKQMSKFFPFMVNCSLEGLCLP